MIKTYYVILVVVIIILLFVAYYVGQNEIKFKNFEKGEKVKIDSSQNLQNVIAEMNNKRREKDNKINGVSAYVNPYERNTLQKRKDKHYLQGTTLFNMYNN